jgi:pyruvate,water dikinase
VDLLRGYVSLDGESPETLLALEGEERIAETARVVRSLAAKRLHHLVPFLSYGVPGRVVIRCTQGAIIRRERVRLKQALMYSRVRRLALAAGERLVAAGTIDAAEDVFLLSIDELDLLIGGRAMFPYDLRRLLNLRREEHEELAVMSPPDSFVLRQEEYLTPDTGPDHSDLKAGEGAQRKGWSTNRDRTDEYPGNEDRGPEGLVLSGTGASGGSVTGVARVLGDVSESHTLTPGEVLVTPQTDPGWAPVFFLVSGLVIERGGMLSHGAIIAREFGIPCVAGVRNATRRIRTGASVTVDGDRSRVTIGTT